jgi:hypothetical protein
MPRRQSPIAGEARIRYRQASRDREGKRLSRKIARSLVVIVGVVWLTAAAATAMVGGGGVATQLTPLSPQPAASSLKPGVLAEIYLVRVQSIGELTQVIAAAGKPSETKVLLHIDYAWGAGNVLGTQSNDFVGARIRGLLRFDRAGVWHLQITSNDGVQVTVGGVDIFEDPEVHSDADSPAIPVTIPEPGYYALNILYFEKKGTATLRLKWLPPGSSDVVPVPATAFAHQP